MIIDYKVENFLSIYEPVEFSLEPLQNKAELPAHTMETPFAGVPQLMRAAAFYGPNASGKTSLFRSLAYLKDLLLNTMSHKKDEPWPNERNQFRGQEDPSDFHIYFIAQQDDGTDMLFDYQLIIFPEYVEYECLKVIQRKADSKRATPENIWLKREYGQSPKEFTIADEILSEEVKQHPNLKNIWLEDLNPNQLLVAFLENKKSIVALDPFIKWWKEQFNPNFWHDLGAASFHMPYSIMKISADHFGNTGQLEHDKKMILDFYRIIGSDIIDIRLEETEQENSDKKSFQIELLHERDGSQFWLELKEESAGTHIWFNLALLVKSKLKNSGVLCIDEIDRSLHPALTRHLINFFNTPESNTGNAQLLFTAHDVQLMDRNLLQPEQVYLLNNSKNKKGTEIYCIGNYKLKNDRDFLYYQNYLRGDFESVPEILHE
ncbi:ATP-binding protein [Candidatus Haliotispira prima]|uniref:ATP-binding protein n=1 Tax=Candidatus Haliotispira prima TaxID=3034016 RepID=A0ABY8MK75_9SPIO|nr:ATP-binding protein [Candidatus Haliotispira prima]